MNQDTPRTNEEARHIYSPGNEGMGKDYAEEVTNADFSRTLERELNTTTAAARAVVDAWESGDLAAAVRTLSETLDQLTP